jgi:hypothetical protein
MAASIIRAWDYAWQDIWQPLRHHEEAPADLFMELYPELIRASLGGELDMDRFYSAANDPVLAEQQFMETQSSAFGSERLLVHFFSEAHSIIVEFGMPDLTRLYESLLAAFFERYNLRFRVGYPFEIVVDPGALFCSMIDAVASRTSPDPHLQLLDSHLKRAFDLLAREGKLPEVHKCIAQASIYVEGIAGSMPGLKPGSLGDLVKKMPDIWPHAGVREAISSLYGFCSNYPNIRHAGNPESRLRELELRDAIIIPMVLMAFSGYFVEVDFSELLCVRASDVPIQIPVPPSAVAADLP